MRWLRGSSSSFTVAVFGLSLSDGSAYVDPYTANASMGAGAGGTPAAGSPVAWTMQSGKKHDCKHGTWEPATKHCNCFKGWDTAGITDTLDFLEGVCEQYHCKSDTTCQELLNIPEATCPVTNWNCYCGWKWAFYFHGHGYETPSKQGGAECMGVMYTFSIWASELLLVYFRYAWIVFAVLTVLFIGVGRKRVNCDHHRPSIWKVFRHMCAIPIVCNGQCVNPTPEDGYNCDSFRDDFAWSLYFMDIGVWSYIFFLVLYLVVLFIWSVVLWTLVIVITIATLVAAACMTCAEGAGEGCSCDCCPGAGGAGGGGCDCCCMGSMAPGAGGGMSDASTFYWSGAWPYDPFWGYSGYGHVGVGDESCSCCGGCFRTLCRPIANLIYVFPVMPENMWGGCLGRIMGTHRGTSDSSMYAGGNCLVDFLGMRWRRNADLHADGEWRQAVYDFLTAEPGTGPGSRNHDQYYEQTNYQPFGGNGQDSRRGMRISGARVVYEERPFSIEQDSCVESSFEDYKKNECWICREGNKDWDMWLSCHHMFCAKCSTEMLKRRMPCPLCRIASSTVLRGHEYNETADSEAGKNS